MMWIYQFAKSSAKNPSDTLNDSERGRKANKNLLTSTLDNNKNILEQLFTIGTLIVLAHTIVKSCVNKSFTIQIQKQQQQHYNV